MARSLLGRSPAVGAFSVLEKLNADLRMARSVLSARPKFHVSFNYSPKPSHMGYFLTDFSFSC
jgi:hypothetical protein